MRSLLFIGSFLIGYGLHSEPILPKPLNERELIEIMADFNIKHIEAPPQTPWYGLTDFDTRIMWIVGDVDIAQRRKAAIHESAHAALKLRGDESWGDEDVIRAFTDLEYKRLFGQ